MIDDVTVIQLSGNTYFWALKKDGKMIATSELIDTKPLVEAEAMEISKQLGFDGAIFIEERE